MMKNGMVLVDARIKLFNEHSTISHVEKNTSLYNITFVKRYIHNDVEILPAWMTD